MDECYADMADEAAALRAQQGDENAINHLLLKYKNFVRAKARTYFLMGADNDDLLQEGMIGLYKAVRDYVPQKASFFAFAELCITRQIITAVKAATRQKHIPLNQSVSLNRTVVTQGGERELYQITAASAQSDPETIIMGEESRAAIEEFMQQSLSTLEREVLSLYLAGMTYTEIGRQIGRPEKSIDNALQRIKSKISAFLKESPPKIR